GEIPPQRSRPAPVCDDPARADSRSPPATWSNTVAGTARPEAYGSARYLRALPASNGSRRAGSSTASRPARIRAVRRSPRLTPSHPLVEIAPGEEDSAARRFLAERDRPARDQLADPLGRAVEVARGRLDAHPRRPGRGLNLGPHLRADLVEQLLAQAFDDLAE